MTVRKVRRILQLATLVLCCLPLATTVGAHESRPGYLQLTFTDAERVHMLFKVPAIGDMRFGLYPNLPSSCEAAGDMSRFIVAGAYTERGTFACPGGLVGETVAIDGLASTLTDVLVRVERADGTTQVARLTPSDPAFVVAAAPDRISVAMTYLTIGVEHILLGIDHLLFVLALLMLVDGIRKMVWTITAFTLAHSLTLVAATLGVIRVPQAPVEAVIALSIVFVASEIVHAARGKPGITQQKPWLVAFTFGLLHGLGFAGALNEVGLPEQAVPLALLFFNVGVELGQLAFVAVVMLAWTALDRASAGVARKATVFAAYPIGIMAAFWTVERIAGFFA